MHDSLHQHLKQVTGIEPDAYAAGTKNGTGFSIAGFREVLVILEVGDMEASATLDVKIQQSSDNGVADAFADVASAVFTQKVDATDDNTGWVLRLNAEGRELYLRVVGVTAVDAVDYGVSVLLGGAEILPVTQANTAVSV